MLSLLLAAALGQAGPPAPAPRVVVMVARQEGLSPLEAAQLAERMAAALSASKVPVEPPSESARSLGQSTALGCRGKPACVAELALHLGAPAAIGVEAADVFGELALHLVLVDARGGVMLERTSVLSPDRLQELDLALGEFAEATRPALKKLPAFAPPPDAPVAPSLIPGPTAQAGVAPEALRPGPPAVAWGLGGMGLASGVAAAVFGALALSTYGRHQSAAGPFGDGVHKSSPLTRAEYDAMNANATVAAVTGGVSAALIAGAAYFFLAPPPPAKP